MLGSIDGKTIDPPVAVGFDVNAAIVAISGVDWKFGGKNPNVVLPPGEEINDDVVGCDDGPGVNATAAAIIVAAAAAAAAAAVAEAEFVSIDGLDKIVEPVK